MRTSNLAKLASLQLLMVACMSDAHAAYPAHGEARNETIFVPNCGHDESQPEWLNCFGTPGDRGRSGSRGNLR